MIFSHGFLKTFDIVNQPGYLCWEVGFPKLGSDILAADSSLYITAHPLEAKFMAIVKSVKVSKVSK